MEQKEAYGMAIDVLLDGEVDYRRMCITLAKELPELFLDVYAASRKSETTNAHRDKILELMRASKKVEAIKLHRTVTGLGLKDAKDAVEAIEREGDLDDPSTVIKSLGELLREKSFPTLVRDELRDKPYPYKDNEDMF